VLEGNGFQIKNNNLLDDVTISNVRIHNLGKPWVDSSSGTLTNSTSNHAVHLAATGSSHVTIQNTIFDASSSVYVYNGNSSTTSFTSNTVLSNSLAPGGVRPDVSYPFFTAEGPSTAAKAFQGNRIYASNLSFNHANNWSISGNVIAGNRGGISVQFSDSIEIANNYIHTLHDFAQTDPDNPYGSQVFNLSFYQSTNVNTHDNVLRDGEWMVQGLSGDFHHNLLLDLQSHNWIINPESGAKIHNNIFAPRYDGQIVGLVSGIRLYDVNATGVEIYNNTFHGGLGFYAPAIDIGANATLTSLRSNLFYNFPIDFFWGNGVVRPSQFETLSGSPPRPAADSNRMAYANSNAFYNPNAKPDTVNYAVGVDSAAYGAANFGSGDLSGIDPRLKGPFLAFPFPEADIKSGAATVQQILARYRDAYSPLSDSPLLGAADPQDQADGRVNIGASTLGIKLISGSDTGADVTDHVTRLNNGSAGQVLQFALGGTAAGATVNLYANGTPIGTATAVGSETIVTTDGVTQLADGVYEITARQSRDGSELPNPWSPPRLTIDTTPPDVSVVFDRDGDAHKLILSFSEPVAPLTLADVELRNLTLGNLVDRSLLSLDWDTTGRVMTIGWPGIAAGNLREGWYTVVTGSESIVDRAGNAPESGTTLEFGFSHLNGDADGDGAVDGNDFSIIKENFGQVGGWAEGDFDGDGRVGFTDYQILGREFGRSLPETRSFADVSTNEILRPQFSTRRVQRPMRRIQRMGNAFD
jgi:parallel beta-helix repeat protein